MVSSPELRNSVEVSVCLPLWGEVGESLYLGTFIFGDLIPQGGCLSSSFPLPYRMQHAPHLARGLVSGRGML